MSNLMKYENKYTVYKEWIDCNKYTAYLFSLSYVNELQNYTAQLKLNIKVTLNNLKLLQVSAAFLDFFFF